MRNQLLVKKFYRVVLLWQILCFSIISEGPETYFIKGEHVFQFYGDTNLYKLPYVGILIQSVFSFQDDHCFNGYSEQKALSS